MTIHRFYAPNLGTRSVDLDAQESHHASGVLRLGEGDAVELFDGKGTVATGRIRIVSKRRVSVEVDETVQHERPTRSRLTLATAIPRSSRQPFLFEKCTELGVHSIWPIAYERSVVKATGTSQKKWQRTIIESGKQCRTPFLPEVLSPARLEEAAASGGDGVTNFICDPEATLGITDALRQTDCANSCQVWIGPEGGMTPTEHSLLIDKGAIAVRLGGNVLRIETAAITVAAAFALLR
ncbi:MAG: 16S rRNA (uracil(1498)-N(3))-methyltransferase [Planctomycetes bacterium]|nr:16S rRNA (uracil(1498)-N(3))-methyltransferase [Planctomycetota bacterium]